MSNPLQSQDLRLRTHRNVAAIALACTLARSVWAMFANGEPYQPILLAEDIGAYCNWSAIDTGIFRAAFDQLQTRLDKE